MQKEIVVRCRQAGKPVIVASHLLQSMIEFPTPTRAEVCPLLEQSHEGHIESVLRCWGPQSLKVSFRLVRPSDRGLWSLSPRLMVPCVDMLPCIGL